METWQQREERIIDEFLAWHTDNPRLEYRLMAKFQGKMIAKPRREFLRELALEEGRTGKHILGNCQIQTLHVYRDGREIIINTEIV